MRFKRKSKYKAIKVEYDGIVFDSKLEGARYKILKALENSGHITDLEVQVPYECDVEGTRICKYIADFRYKVNGETVVEDTKGVLTQVFKLKKKLVEALYPGTVIVIVKDPRAAVIQEKTA